MKEQDEERRMKRRKGNRRGEGTGVSHSQHLKISGEVLKKNASEGPAG